MHKNTKITIGIVAVAVFALAGAAMVFLPADLRFGVSLPQPEFRIEKGDSLTKIADALAEQGLIRSTFIFKSYTTIVGQNTNLKAGRYRLSPAMSISDLVRVFSSGLYESDDISVTIPEGSNINDLDNIFAKAGLTKSGDFLKADYINQEGYLFPDTYRFESEISKEMVVKKLETNFYDRTDALLDFGGVSETDNSPAIRTVIIASMLEKEVQTKEDMAIVSGIIQNRLDKQMLLQIDATVAYGVCLKSFLVGKHCDVTQVNLIEAIKATDLYNTYKNTGLPPGPISNPGEQAIYAALHPADTDYFYYLTDKAGNAHYGRTAAEHAQNRQKYLNK